SGIGIGLLNLNETPIELNTPSLAQNLAKNDTEIQFKAYVEAEPEARINETITYGNFYSTAYYTLNYQ
ncbi:type 1 fimbrial protein, partial [Escherichia coli]|nr:type 1 fimbrial protein [Escherichia coli]